MDESNDIQNKSVGRPRLGENNTRLSDDIEHNRTYHRNYYREKMSIRVECPLCNRLSTLEKLPRHQTTALCMKNRIPPKAKI